jgi:hypothetical protein
MEYASVMPAAVATVTSGERPSSTPPILIAARVTFAMISTLKSTPR